MFAIGFCPLPLAFCLLLLAFLPFALQRAVYFLLKAFDFLQSLYICALFLESTKNLRFSVIV